MRELYYAGTMSCAEVSVRIEKSIPLTTQVLNDLISDGLVTEKGLAPSSGGRRPSVYSAIPDARFLVAVAMDQMMTRIAVMNMKNIVVGEIHTLYLPLDNNPATLDKLTAAIAETISKSGVNRKRIAGVGIGMPGFIDTKLGINYTFLATGSGTITSHLTTALELPVFIDNDSSIIALAEHRFGAAKDVANAMVINIGWGIGLGMVLNNVLYRGQSGFAGEFSHIPVFNNNKLCSCGKYGCLETETSLHVVIDKVAEGLTGQEVSALKKDFRTGRVEEDWLQVVKAAEAGDSYVIRLLSEAGYQVGRGVAVLIHIFNPGMIVLSGRGVQAGTVWQAPVMQALAEHCIPRLLSGTDVRVSTLGYQAELIGAAALVVESLVRERKEKKKKTVYGKQPV